MRKGRLDKKEADLEFVFLPPKKLDDWHRARAVADQSLVRYEAQLCPISQSHGSDLMHSAEDTLGFVCADQLRPRDQTDFQCCTLRWAKTRPPPRLSPPTRPQRKNLQAKWSLSFLLGDWRRNPSNTFGLKAEFPFKALQRSRSPFASKHPALVGSFIFNVLCTLPPTTSDI